MKRLKIMNLLTALDNAKKILEQLEEFDDYDIIELLELKYEKIYQQTYNI
jgi:hypothetical protein